jgi:transcriptional regulator with XRE-family HTH domain
MTVLGKRIRYLRQQANLTQVQLGKLLGCSSSTVSLYTSFGIGNSFPSS